MNGKIYTKCSNPIPITNYRNFSVKDFVIEFFDENKQTLAIIHANEFECFKLDPSEKTE